ncbi:MAG TPA: type II toxin-antitoxin system VapC family toxin [Pyrinomonadaceae bacterium]|jgi:predicted nucleic acid-binding protein|nr:type II toxin-antitoxin system VapC family toxin [Pyrinomonadaceae bacterium]
MKLVVDASVAVKWYVPEIFEADADRVLRTASELHAPELILPEFSNIIWKKIRLGEITGPIGRNIVNAFSNANMTLHSHRHIVKSAFTGAAMSGQTVYDWTYLALAVALSCELVTADESFYRSLEATSMRRHLLWIKDV